VVTRCQCFPFSESYKFCHTVSAEKHNHLDNDIAKQKQIFKNILFIFITFVSVSVQGIHDGLLDGKHILPAQICPEIVHKAVILPCRKLTKPVTIIKEEVGHFHSKQCNGNLYDTYIVKADASAQFILVKNSSRLIDHFNMI
jgi:predicted PP-loop superfamily ATPase